MNILKHYTDTVGMPEEQVEMINEMTICFFQSCLNRVLADKPSEEEREQLVEHVVEGARFLLK